MNLPEYAAIRLDRDSKKTQKQLGGGLGMLVNNKWSTNETVNSKHYEIDVDCVIQATLSPSRVWTYCSHTCVRAWPGFHVRS